MNQDKIYLRLNRPKKIRSDNPVVILSVRAYKKMMLWTTLAAQKRNWEVSGLGTVSPRHNGLFVNDVWLIKPEKVGTAHVDMDPKAIQQLMLEIATRGPQLKHLKQYIKEYTETGMVSNEEAFIELADIMSRGTRLKSLRFAWHSHANFGVGWSGTDERTAQHDFCPDAKYTVSIVTNAQGHFLARQDFPRSKEPTKHDLPVMLLLGLPKPMSKKLREEYEEKHQDCEKDVGRYVEWEDLMAVV